MSRYARTKLSLFRTTSPLFTEISWRLFGKLAKYFFSQSKQKRAGFKSSNLDKKGFVKISASNISYFKGLSETAIPLLNRKQRRDSYVTTIMSHDDEKLSDAISIFLFENYEIISNKLGFNFIPYWASCYRTVPGVPEKGSSFIWHMDGDPSISRKIFIYLNDVTRSNGALRMFGETTTDDLITNGFESYSIKSREDSQKLVERYLRDQSILEGKSGTCLVFKNSLIHRGVLPEKGFRDVVSIEIFPSLKKPNLSNLKGRLRKKRHNDFPLFPIFS